MIKCIQKRCRRKTVGQLCPKHSRQPVIETDLVNPGNNGAVVHAWGVGEQSRHYNWRHTKTEKRLKKEIRGLEPDPSHLQKAVQQFKHLCRKVKNGLWSTPKQGCGNS